MSFDVRTTSRAPFSRLTRSSSWGGGRGEGVQGIAWPGAARGAVNHRPKAGAARPQAGFSLRAKGKGGPSSNLSPTPPPPSTFSISMPYTATLGGSSTPHPPPPPHPRPPHPTPTPPPTPTLTFSISMSYTATRSSWLDGSCGDRAGAARRGHSQAGAEGEQAAALPPCCCAVSRPTSLQPAPNPSPNARPQNPKPPGPPTCTSSSRSSPFHLGRVVLRLGALRTLWPGCVNSSTCCGWRSESQGGGP
jgi:hypothetical protein